MQVAAIRHYRGSFLKVNVPFVPMLLLQKLQRSGVEDDAVRINFRDASYLEYPSLSQALAGLTAVPTPELAPRQADLQNRHIDHFEQRQ